MHKTLLAFGRQCDINCSGGSVGEEEVDEAAMRLEVREADDGERTWSLNAPKFC